MAPKGPAPTNVNFSEVSMQLLTSVACLILLAFFSLSETAITTLWPWKVLHALWRVSVCVS